MTSSSTLFKVGTRRSKLALIQTRDALDRCERLLSSTHFMMVPIVTPGDLDRKTDLRHSPADFFSRDLDEALLSGTLDCAVHSAKDLPDEPPEGIDYFWLPWREDPRDVILLPRNIDTLPTGAFRIGVSSDRRERYCRTRFPAAELASVRGNIDERLAQLDRGDFDMLIMAAAALHRLDLRLRIFEYIPLADLSVPDGQGVLALTFRRGDRRFLALRNLLIHPVLLAGAGIGSADNATQAVVTALRSCDLCLHDSLLPDELLNLVPENAVQVAVGKRSGRHSVSQDDICRYLLKYARHGRRVVRLKGGDPTVFGRLAEETAALQSEHIPFRVLPGVGAFSVAAASTGILPSRRNTARGFTVITPRRAGQNIFAGVPPGERLRLPHIFYMATTVLPQLVNQYLEEGFPSETPVALVFDAGSPQEHVLYGTLANIAEKREAYSGTGPGLVFLGDIADPGQCFKTHAPLEAKRVLYCGAEQGVSEARQAINRYGGRCIPMPCIKLDLAANARKYVAECASYDWLLVTSPSCAQLFFQTCIVMKIDLRRLPRLIVCGPGTAQIFRERGVFPDIIPQQGFGTEGLSKELEKVDFTGQSILRLRSDRAGSGLADALRKRDAHVDDVEFYRNLPLSYDKLPDAEVVVFTSRSSVQAFLEDFGPPGLAGKLACAIGKPTAEWLKEKAGVENPLIAVEATIKACIATIAGYYTARKMRESG